MHLFYLRKYKFEYDLEYEINITNLTMIISNNLNYDLVNIIQLNSYSINHLIVFHTSLPLSSNL